MRITAQLTRCFPTDVFPEIAIYSSSDLEYTVEEYEGELSLCSMLLVFVGGG